MTSCYIRIIDENLSFSNKIYSFKDAMAAILRELMAHYLN